MNSERRLRGHSPIWEAVSVEGAAGQGPREKPYPLGAPAPGLPRTCPPPGAEVWTVVAADTTCGLPELLGPLVLFRTNLLSH